MPGRLVIEPIHGPSLEGNRCGDPTTRRTPVYLPPSYDSEPTRRYPVIYVLAGFTGSALSFVNYAVWSPNLFDRLDAMMERGAPEAIVVMADGMTRWGGSQYLSSPAHGGYQEYVADDVVAYVDARYRTLPEAAHRGVAGKSSGGFAALHLAMRRSDRFGAAACHSGDMYFDYAYRGEIAQAAAAVAARGGLEPWLRAFEASHRKSAADFAAINVLAMSCAYSPSLDPSAALPWADLPFDLDSYAFRDDVWQRWLEHDPYRMVDPASNPAAETFLTRLRALRCLFIDVGSRDEYHLHLGARLLSRRLQAAGVPHVYEEFDDGHRDTSYRYERSLPLLAAALTPQPNP